MLHTVEKYVVQALVGSSRNVAHRHLVSDEVFIASERGKRVDHSAWTAILARCVHLGCSKGGLTDLSLFDYTDSSLPGDLENYLSQVIIS